MAISSRTELKDYCLETNGAPIVTINISETQLNNCIDDALEYFQEYALDAQSSEFYQHTLTAQDITNMYIELPDNVLSVIKVYGHSTMSSSSALFSAEYHIASDIILAMVGSSGGSSGVSNYFISKQALADMNFLFNPDMQFRYRVNNRKLYIDCDWQTKFIEGNKIMVEVYAFIDEDVYSKVWNSRQLKDLAAAMVKKQWGSNLTKFNGVALAGGVTLNGQMILEEAIQAIAEIKDDIYQFQEPLGLLIA